MWPRVSWDGSTQHLRGSQGSTPRPCLAVSAERHSGAGGLSACAGGDASRFDHPLGIPGHFPQMSVRILEVARVPAPPGVMRRFDHDGPGPRGLGHDFVDFDFGSHVVPNGTRGRAGAPQHEPRIMRHARARPEREFQARLQVKERDGPIRELGADNAVRFQAKPIAVEPDGRLQILHAKGDERDPRLHTQTLHKTAPVMPGPCGPAQARGEGVRAGWLHADTQRAQGAVTETTSA